MPDTDAGEEAGDDPDRASQGAPSDGGGIFRDEHLDPDDPLTTMLRGEPAPDQEQRQYLRRTLQSEAASRHQGRLPRSFTEEVDASSRPKTDWRALLAEFVDRLRRSDYRLFSFRKMTLWQGLYLPSAGVPAPDHLVVAIDTSGSMSGDDIRRILGEIDRLRSSGECRLTVLQCDTAIHKVEKLDPHETASWHEDAAYQVYGRGGTDFRPVFEWISGDLIPHEGAPDACIYMTDGYGHFPDNAPDYPVVWLLQPQGSTRFPFGRVILMQE